MSGTGTSAGGYTLQPYFNSQWGVTPDTIAGLYVMGHRDYDPSTGRFLNRDPIGYLGGENLYAYTDDDPVGWSDPDGLNPSSPDWFNSSFYTDPVHYKGPAPPVPPEPSQFDYDSNIESAIELSHDSNIPNLGYQVILFPWLDTEARGILGRR